jgi:hypothetical protein
MGSTCWGRLCKPGIVVAWVGALGVVACASSGPALPDRPLLPGQVFQQRTFPLPSGLKVLVQEDHSAPLVSVVTVVAVGSSADPPGQEGLAHLVEHLAYRPLGERLKRTGATYNATTEPDRTTYYALAHKDQVGELLAVEGQRLAQTLEGVTPEVLEVERDVVRNEARQRGINPRVIGELFKRAFPGGHPLNRLTDGQHALGTTTRAAGGEPPAEQLGRDVRLRSRVEHRPGGIAHLLIEGTIDPGRTADAIGRLLAFVGQVASAGPNMAAFTLERWDLGREFNLRFATGPGVANAVLSAARRGWPAAVWDAYPARLAALQRGAVRDLLAPCTGREIVTVVGNKAGLMPRMRELGLVESPAAGPQPPP